MDMDQVGRNELVHKRPLELLDSEKTPRESKRKISYGHPLVASRSLRMPRELAVTIGRGREHFDIDAGAHESLAQAENAPWRTAIHKSRGKIARYMDDAHRAEIASTARPTCGHASFSPKQGAVCARCCEETYRR